MIMAADLSAPSFSLGLDLDVDDEEDDPFIPNPPIQEGNDGEDHKSSDALMRLRRGPPPPPPAPPSFSLGLDPDFEEEEEEEGLTVPDSPIQEEDRPVLKRLRRGLPPQRPVAATLDEEGNGMFDDDIEDFSSQEDEDRRRQPDISPSLQSHATCSSSKISLHSRGVLSSQSTSKLMTPMISTAYNASASKSFEASSNKDLFPRLTVSPLRKILLLDSDSDNPSPSKGKVNSKEAEPSDKKRKGVPFQSAIRNDEKMFRSHKHQTESFWKDFSPKENVNLPTPALDEFCDEYFKSAKDQKIGHRKEVGPSFCSSKVLDPDDSIDDFEFLFQQNSSCSKPEHNWDFPHPKPPSYQYFFHDDARIRALIQERLPHFAPIGAKDHRGIQHSAGDGLDYMGQFCPRDGPSKVHATTGKGSSRSSKTNQKRPSSANCKEAPPTTGNWVNPRSNATIPKDAGKRRVCAVGNQRGHWYTGRDGRKVYVSQNGQELTGQAAYRHYRKDSGTGFRRSNKKAATKKKRK